MNKPNSPLLIAIFIFTLISSAFTQTAFSQPTQLLDPLTTPKFVNQLAQLPPVYVPTNVTDGSGKLIRQEYIVKVSEFTQQILPTATASGAPTGFGPTKVWGYEGEAKNALTGENLGVLGSTPGSTFEQNCSADEGKSMCYCFKRWLIG